MFKRLRSAGLGAKLLVIITFTLVVFFVSTLLVINDGLTNLTREEVVQDTHKHAEIIGDRLRTLEDELALNARFLAGDDVLIEAIQNNDTATVIAIIEADLRGLDLDDVDVANTDGELFVVVAPNDEDVEEEGEDVLIFHGLNNREQTGLVIDMEDGLEVRLAAVAPIRTRAGEVIGAMLVSRILDDDLLNVINFSREDQVLKLIYRDEVVSVSNELGTTPGSLDGIATIRQPMRLSLVSSAIVTTQTLQVVDGGTYSVSHVPLVLNGQAQAVMELIEDVTPRLQEQQALFLRTTGIIGLVIIGLTAFVVIGAQFSLVRDIVKLRDSAQAIAGGQYTQRVNVNRKDEIGQLEVSFNKMAEAIEDRDNRQIRQLEQKVHEAQTARDQAEKSDRVKSAFLASMSHELRTPLNSIINFSKFVARGTVGPVNAEQVGMLNDVVNSGQHLLVLINDVLDMSKIEAGSLNLFVENNIDINTLLNSAVTTASALIGEKPITIVTEIDPTLPRLRADRQRVLQILLNMLSNAAKFTDEGGIVVRAMAAGSDVLISVEDTGPGIPESDHDSVFQAFKQTRSGLRQGGAGTGLGMPISRSLAEAHGGALTLESTPGVGTTFILRLPVVAVTKPLTIAPPPVRSTVLTPAITPAQRITGEQIAAGQPPVAPPTLTTTPAGGTA